MACQLLDTSKARDLGNGGWVDRLKHRELIVCHLGFKNGNIIIQGKTGEKAERRSCMIVMGTSIGESESQVRTEIVF